MKRFSAAIALTALIVAGCKSEPSPLINPPAAEMTRQAPDSFKAEFTTSKGRFVIQVRRDWAPVGADRFYFLANNKYYDGTRFFRVLPNFMAQWGIHGDPAVSAAWQSRTIPDEPVKASNQPTMVSFAMAGPNSRTTQIFVNTADNSRLDAMGFAPFGRVVDGMQVVMQLYSEYGEGAHAPDQAQMRQNGNKYLDRWFPKLDSVVHVRIIP